MANADKCLVRGEEPPVWRIVKGLNGGCCRFGPKLKCRGERINHRVSRYSFRNGVGLIEVYVSYSWSEQLLKIHILNINGSPVLSRSVVLRLCRS